ncbi:MAG: LysM peptidoglycan-binding domain-containing protein [Clostridiales bacterium]|nr:LysM peptidoglycan-binding domain-containing protein [Clostridiales bacterium]
MFCPYPVAYSVRAGDNLHQIAHYYHTTVPSLLALNPNVDPYNMQIGSTLIICPGEDLGRIQEPSDPPGAPSPQQVLAQDMRMVWEQHVFWTRLLLVSIAARLGDQAATTDRLLRNPRDIADIFARYYNENTAAAIAQLLTEHLQIGAQLITALRDGETQKAQELTAQWYANADKMAEAFSLINPYYDRTEMRAMLRRHLDLTTNEVAARLAGRFADDIAAFDLVEQEALQMADTFTLGIMKQFPHLF